MKKLLLAALVLVGGCASPRATVGIPKDVPLAVLPFQEPGVEGSFESPLGVRLGEKLSLFLKDRGFRVRAYPRVLEAADANVRAAALLEKLSVDYLVEATIVEWSTKDQGAWGPLFHGRAKVRVTIHETRAGREARDSSEDEHDLKPGEALSRHLVSVEFPTGYRQADVGDEKEIRRGLEAAVVEAVARLLVEAESE